MNRKEWEKSVYCEGVQTWKYFVQRGCGASMLEDIYNSTGRGPGQPALADPA